MRKGKNTGQNRSKGSSTGRSGKSSRSEKPARKSSSRNSRNSDRDSSFPPRSKSTRSGPRKTSNPSFGDSGADKRKSRFSKDRNSRFTDEKDSSFGEAGSSSRGEKKSFRGGRFSSGGERPSSRGKRSGFGGDESSPRENRKSNFNDERKGKYGAPKKPGYKRTSSESDPDKRRSRFSDDRKSGFSKDGNSRFSNEKDSSFKKGGSSSRGEKKSFRGDRFSSGGEQAPFKAERSSSRGKKSGFSRDESAPRENRKSDYNDGTKGKYGAPKKPGYKRTSSESDPDKRRSRFSDDKPSRPFKKDFDSQGDKKFAGKKTEGNTNSPRKRISKRQTGTASYDASTSEAAPVQTEKMRLNRYIANSGVCSRREADELISMGLITVNGKSVSELGYKVNPGDQVRYEGRLLKAEKPVYLLLNKPKGFLTTTNDPQERNTVMHLIGGKIKERIYPVGRLDRNTTGLLLLTNDGDLADKLMHPSYNVKKIYKVELDRPITRPDLEKIIEGVPLEEGKAQVDDIAVVSEDNKTVGIELHIGWNRVVRRIFEALGYEVVKLDRSVYAGLDKKDLPRGEWRHLKKEEIIRLKHYK